jgi:hypothetical protein
MARREEITDERRGVFTIALNQTLAEAQSAFDTATVSTLPSME